MNIKEKLKENDFLRRIVKKHKIRKEFLADFNDFNNYYNDSGLITIQTIEYKILLLVHSLEKGMCNKELRAFGTKKIKDLINLLNQYIIISDKKYSTPFMMGCSIITEWLKIYDNNNFEKDETYKLAYDFIKIHTNSKDIKVGAFEYSTDNLIEYFETDYYNFLKSRHSVREFLNKPISNDDIEYCLNSALISPTACNRQMIKIYSVKQKNKKELLNKHIMGLSGFEINSINYFVITFDISAFSFYGERNQGYFNAGLVAMNFVNAMHSKKIGSCFLQWGNTYKEEINIKKNLDIPENEKIAVVIAAGYYKDKTLVPLSQRKKIEEIYKEI